MRESQKYASVRTTEWPGTSLISSFSTTSSATVNSLLVMPLPLSGLVYSSTPFVPETSPPHAPLVVSLALQL